MPQTVYIGLVPVQPGPCMFGTTGAAPMAYLGVIGVPGTSS